MLAGVLPDAEVLEQSRTPFNLDALRARAAGVQPELEQDPEMVEFMAQHMREYEQSWLHMELPALDGDTPRPAAADPTRREDLQQLLASFDAMPSQPGGMSADRLRVLLGLWTGWCRSQRRCAASAARHGGPGARRCCTVDGVGLNQKAMRGRWRDGVRRP